MGATQITLSRGLFRLWIIFTVVWVLAFTGIAVKNFHQSFWVTHQEDLERYRQTLVDNAQFEKERCDGPTPGKRCNERAIENDPSSPTNAELDKAFKDQVTLSPPARPKMIPLFSPDGFEWVLKYIVIAFAGPILLFAAGGAALWAARGFVGSPP